MGMITAIRVSGPQGQMVDLTDQVLAVGPTGVDGPNILLPSFTDAGWREHQGTLSARKMAIALRHVHPLAKYEVEWARLRQAHGSVCLKTWRRVAFSLCVQVAVESALLMSSFGVQRGDAQMHRWLDAKANEHLKDWGIDSIGDRFWGHAKQVVLDGEEWYSSARGFQFLVPVDVTFQEGECRCEKSHPIEEYNRNATPK